MLSGAKRLDRRLLRVIVLACTSMTCIPAATEHRNIAFPATLVGLHGLPCTDTVLSAPCRSTHPSPIDTCLLAHSDQADPPIHSSRVSIPSASSQVWDSHFRPRHAQSLGDSRRAQQKRIEGKGIRQRAQRPAPQREAETSNPGSKRPANRSPATHHLRREVDRRGAVLGHGIHLRLGHAPSGSWSPALPTSQLEWSSGSLRARAAGRGVNRPRLTVTLRARHRLAHRVDHLAEQRAIPGSAPMLMRKCCAALVKVAALINRHHVHHPNAVCQTRAQKLLLRRRNQRRHRRSRLRITKAVQHVVHALEVLVVLRERPRKEDIRARVPSARRRVAGRADRRRHRC